MSPYDRSNLKFFCLTHAGLAVTFFAWSSVGQAVRFEKKTLCDEAYYCDGIATGDFDRDGNVDIVAGPFWYEGPGFERRREIYRPVPFNPATGQSDGLFSDVYDFNGDGWDDVLARGRVHMHPARWYENPQGKERHWPRHFVFSKIQSENSPFTDITGNGRPEIVTHWEGQWGYVAPDWSRPKDPWTFHPLGAPGDWPQFHHGQGAGDLTGDGLTDILINEGWLSREANQSADSRWHFRPFRFSKRGGAQMLVFDVDGDGDNDVVTSLDAHGWGLAWFENMRDPNAGRILLQPHTIMGTREEEAKYGVAFSQLHALTSGDIDNDGLTDVVAGKRRWAHGPTGDVEPNAPAVVYWFRLQRTDDGVHFIPHLIDDNSGVGLQIAAVDVNADGRLDVLTASKLGTFLFLSTAGDPPYPPSQRISDIAIDWSTHKRFAQGSDNFQLTWSDDNHLYGAWGDGGGFGGTNKLGRQNLGVARIEGPAGSYRGFNVWGGHEPEHPATFDGKSWGMISVDGSLAMWVVPDKPNGKTYRNHYEYIELASSTDHAATWKKAAWRFHQFEHLTIPTFLNFGKDNAGVPLEFGDYIYSYFIRPQDPTMEQTGPHGVGLIVHRPGAIYLARVRAHDLFADRSRYEFFRGLNASGEPRWGSVVDKRPVFEDANGVGWCMSASYNADLRCVLLCTEHTTSKRGFIGVFDAPYPWGPWTTVKYYDESSPFGMHRNGSHLPWRSNVFFVAFATKWLDGTKFVLNFTGAGQGKDNDSFNTVHGELLER